MYCSISFIYILYFFFFKQKTAYEITRRDWSSDVCSSDLRSPARSFVLPMEPARGLSDACLAGDFAGSSQHLSGAPLRGLLHPTVRGAGWPCRAPHRELLRFPHPPQKVARRF